MPDYSSLTTAEAIRRLALVPLVHEPGDDYKYGLSVDVLGRLVEVLSGMPFDEFLQDRIFKPLKMRDTHFYIPKMKASRLAPNRSIWLPTSRNWTRCGQSLATGFVA